TSSVLSYYYSEKILKFAAYLLRVGEPIFNRIT
ncbi:MAG: hypothetical protein ACI90V_005565, partial [Bacillariaceae sp.]